jgi:4-amino-4-deoxy-L-arabinose transferase-like glycosyltransferase
MVKKYLHHPDLPVIGVLFISLVVGVFIYRDYGITWDEPLYYKYADAVPYAYSIRARLQPGYDIENAYGPSASDHKMYGPPYILAARPLVLALSALTNATSYERWHLINFCFFLVGVWFFYLLCKRWVSKWAAFAASGLLLTQPVLWGHAFINPKDMPFLVFFLIALYAGFKLVDATILTGDLNKSLNKANPEQVRADWPGFRKNLVVAGSLFFVLLILLVTLSDLIRDALVKMIDFLYHTNPTSLVGTLFRWIAPNMVLIPVEDYYHKTLLLYERFENYAIGISIPVVITGGLAILIPHILLRILLRWETSNLGPLPRLSFVWQFETPLQKRQIIKFALLAGIALGAMFSIRVIAPLIGILILISYFLRHERRNSSAIFIYLVITAISLYIIWPYLWDSPITRLYEAFQYFLKINNTKPVLFNGKVFPSNELPWSYLPILLTITLSEPVWILFVIGLVTGLWFMYRGKLDWRTFIPMLSSFGVVFLYILVRQPPMYDGYRHYLFIIPPIFAVTALAFHLLEKAIHIPLIHNLFLVACLLPGVIGLVQTHPYQYAYYNSTIGSLGGAYRNYETDYWLTCYKEAMIYINANIPSDAILYVHRQPAIAREFANRQFEIKQYDPAFITSTTENWILLTTRHNSDHEFDSDLPILHQVEHNGAVFCMVKLLK